MYGHVNLHLLTSDKLNFSRYEINQLILCKIQPLSSTQIFTVCTASSGCKVVSISVNVAICVYVSVQDTNRYLVS